MKKIIACLILSVLFTYVTQKTIHAQSATAAPTQEVDNDIKQKIIDLKDRLATRVAELKSQNKRSFNGVIKSKEEGVLTLTQKDTEMKVVFDTDSKISSINKQGKKSISDTKSLVVGQNVTAFGTLDLDQKTLVAKVVVISEVPVIISGTVKAVDVKEGTFSVDNPKGLNLLDYEISTKCLYFEKGKPLSTCGLTKVSVGDRIIVRIEQKDGSLARSTALRMLVIPQNQPAVSAKPSAAASPSAKPTVKITVKPTVKASVTPAE